MYFNDYAAKLDDRIRYADLTYWRMSGGPLTAFGAKRQNFEAFLWPSLLAAALWSGMPTLRSSQASGIVVGIVCCTLLLVLNSRSRTATWDAFTQIALLSFISGLVWIVGVDEAGTNRIVYRHLLIPVVVLVGMGLLFAAALARWLRWQFRSAQPNYSACLSSTELFQIRGARLSWGGNEVFDLVLASISVLFRPLEFAWPIAVAALLASPAFIKLRIQETAAYMFMLSVLAGLDDRLDSSLHLLLKRFFRGAAFVVSIVVIGLGAARFAGSTYITTIFDSASGTEIIIYLLVPYALAWWYDYWVDRMLGQELLLLLGAVRPDQVSVEYPYVHSSVTDRQEPTDVPADGRLIEVHGQGRFLIYREDPKGQLRFQAWPYQDLFVQLAAVGAPGGNAKPLPSQIEQRISTFRTATAIFTLALLCAGGSWLHAKAKNEEELVNASQKSQVSLSKLLDPSVYTSTHPAILVAASGGGTRAAVFTGSVLEAITRIPNTSISLGSGVSGGSAALALYAGERNQLKRGDAVEWQSYFNRITQPYIQDVIERAQEWRMVERGRLGILLAESFERRWQLPSSSDHLGDLNDFALITNATLAGRFDMCFLSEDDRKKWTLADASEHFRSLTRSDVAGGRFIMTNLDMRDVFPHPAKTAQNDCEHPRLPIVVSDPASRLERVAALSSNFPPVFSNAAVDVNGVRPEHRYWVTDGGAADNRGLEPVLYALRHVAAEAPPQTKLPAVVVVLVDASGIDDSYSQDRGVSGALGAGSHFADQLNTELENNLQALYDSHGQHSDVQFVEVLMPRMLRTSGSFGTHWMLQGSIHVDATAVLGGEKIVVTGDEVVSALRAAYGCGPTPNIDVKKLKTWIMETSEFARWCSSSYILGGNVSGQPCTCQL